MTKFDYLAIGKRDADCYDVTDGSGRVAALRAEFIQGPGYERTMIPGTWQIRWEGPDHRTIPAAIEALRFNSAHEAFAFFCGQCLK